MAEISPSRSQQAAPTERLASSLDKPLLDNRTYRVIRSPNQLEALLIHDPDTDKASAAMDVNAGSFSDRDDLPGMAHAVEHLLFMGTKKYPGENDYNQYLTRYGGSSNAFTAACDTNYYFELSASSTPTNSQASSLSSKESLQIPKSQAPLYGALDRFAQFFIQPLFLEESLDRELRAVDSENKKNLQSDMWRLHQLNKSLANKKHPFHGFSTGNYKTLHDEPLSRGVQIREEFINFYKEQYSANRMKSAVLGRESLDESESWVHESFSEIPNQDLPKLRWDDIPAYSESELGTQIFAKPVMDQRLLDIYFPYPDEDELWESQPSKYISHLSGHEGPGSVLAYIKAKGWANSLGSGPMNVCPGTAFFSISMRLTEDGSKNYQEIVKIIFQYIAMLKEQPPQEWIVEEMKQSAEVDFKFKQKIPASRTTSSLSGVMQKPFPRDRLLSAQSSIWKFNPEAISRGLAHSNPDNFRMTIVSQEVPGTWDQKEKWYGTDYKYEKIPQDFLDELHSISKASSSARPAESHLPAKNEFVPSRLDVEVKEVEQPAIAPRLIRNDENVRTWYKKDDQFWAPKANVQVCLRSASVNVSALTAVLTQIFRELVEDSSSEYSYDAELAGLEYHMLNHAQGLDVTVSGYNDKMAVLLEKVSVSMRDLEVKEDRFNIIKDRLLRGWRNFDYQQPFQQIGTYSRWIMSERGYINQQLSEELPAVTADDVRAFFPQILRQMHIEILVHGNSYREDALKISDLVESTSKTKRSPASQWPIRRTLVSPSGSNYVYKRDLKDPANVNHCIEYMTFSGINTDRKSRAKLSSFAQMADEPCFDTLRTKEQLGYIVHGGPTVLPAVHGYRISIQSEKSPEYLEKRIDVFLNGLSDTSRNMSESEFDTFKTGVINKRSEKLKNSNQETARFWHHITSEAFDYESVYRDVENIEPLTKDDMIEYYDTYFNPASSSRAKASVHLVAQTSPKEVAENTDPKEQTTKLCNMSAQLLTQSGIPADVKKLEARMEGVDVAGGDVDAIVAAIGSYLSQDEAAPQEQIDMLSQNGSQILGQILPQLGIMVKTAEVKDDGASITSSEAKLPSSQEAVVIQDVREFKASIPLSEGIRPVKDLSEFEELEPKL